MSGPERIWVDTRDPGSGWRGFPPPKNFPMDAYILAAKHERVVEALDKIERETTDPKMQAIARAALAEDGE